MRLMVLRAFQLLIRFEHFLARNDFAGLYEAVRNFQVRKCVSPDDAVLRICSAVDLACIWYWKEVLCLQRAATTTCLLKQCGIPAQIVIGAQKLPFRAHAWVEVNGNVVNDKPYMPEMYAVLDRC